MSASVLDEKRRQRILDPAPGTALARAKAYGIDLTFILRAVESTPQERLERAEAAGRIAHEIAAVRAARKPS